MLVNDKVEKQEMLHVLTIAIKEIVHTCTSNLKYSNIDVQQAYVSKKVKIWLFYEVSFIFFSGRNTIVLICATVFINICATVFINTTVFIRAV